MATTFAIVSPRNAHAPETNPTFIYEPLHLLYDDNNNQPTTKITTTTITTMATTTTVTIVSPRNAHPPKTNPTYI